MKIYRSFHYICEWEMDSTLQGAVARTLSFEQLHERNRTQWHRNSQLAGKKGAKVKLLIWRKKVAKLEKLVLET